jgi:hypothetical protein
MGRQASLLLLGVALVLLGGWLTLGLSRPRHRITRENIERIEQGMTRQEVAALLGAPPGNYSRHQIPALYDPGLGHSGPPVDELHDCEGTVEEWVGDRSAVRVCFAANGRVAKLARGMVLLMEVPLLERLRWRLGL